jgi:hypothetical protein
MERRLSTTVIRPNRLAKAWESARFVRLSPVGSTTYGTGLYSNAGGRCAVLCGSDDGVEPVNNGANVETLWTHRSKLAATGERSK